MQPPRFWYNPPQQPGWQSRLLAPLGAAYAYGTARRLTRGVPFRARVPVICIGNINAGGTGKTPAAIALVQLLAARGVAAHLVSRGYGGTLSKTAAEPVRVSERLHGAAEVGDEPLLLSAFAPVWVSINRAKAVAAAQAAGAQAIVLDDGFQNPSVHKDLSLVVVDAHQGFGNGKVLPAGPLREPVLVGLARADLLLTVGDDRAQGHFTATWGMQVALPRIEGALEALQTGMDWTGLKVLAFAGIGQPEKFFATLRALGAILHRTEALADHQPLSDRLMQRLLAEAESAGAQLVTTEKDAARLPARLRNSVLTLPVRMSLRDPQTFLSALDRIGL